jgi:hypothetical protein
MSENTATHDDYTYKSQLRANDKNENNITTKGTIQADVIIKHTDSKKNSIENNLDPSDAVLYCRTVTDTAVDNGNTKNQIEQSKTTKCSLCNCSVKFPSRMSYLQHDYDRKMNKINQKIFTQKEFLRSDGCTFPCNNKIDLDENEYYENHSMQQQENQSVGNGDIQEIRLNQSYKYLFEFLSSSAYKELCKVEHHGTDNSFHF